MTRRNDTAGQAVAKYKEFHRLEPRSIGDFPASFRIPNTVYRAGPAKHVLYRSAKVDPETLRQPRKPVDYIHEHNAGVVCYVTRRQDVDDGQEVQVPRKYAEAQALTRLGYCLGFAFEDPDGDICEAEGRRPLPDLYCTPDGKCLLVIQDREKVLAMMWGGALGVFGRGIDG